MARFDANRNIRGTYGSGWEGDTPESYRTVFRGDDDKDEDDVIPKNGFCYAKPKHMKDEDYEKEKHKGNIYAPYNYPAPAPRSILPKEDPCYVTSYLHNYNDKYKGNSRGPLAPYYGSDLELSVCLNDMSSHDANRNIRGCSYDIIKQHYGGRNASFTPEYYKTTENVFSRGGGDDDEDDVKYKNGFSYPKPKHMKDEDYEKEKNKGYGYASYNYTAPAPAPHSTQPKKDPHHVTSYPHNHNEKHKGNSYSPPTHTHTVPAVTTQPRKYPYCETIDSAEARRRYGRASLKAGPQAKEKYKGTVLDYNEAERKYKGVLVDID